MKEIELSSETFNMVMKMSNNFRANDDSRPVLKKICLKAEKNKIIFVAINGFIASKISINYTMVALKCKDCGAWLKWCPKNERKYYYHNTLKKDKWQILKEFVVNRIYYAGYDIQEHGSRVLTDIIDKMQELEGEDE